MSSNSRSTQRGGKSGIGSRLRSSTTNSASSSGASGSGSNNAALKVAASGSRSRSTGSAMLPPIPASRRDEEDEEADDSSETIRLDLTGLDLGGPTPGPSTYTQPFNGGARSASRPPALHSSSSVHLFQQGPPSPPPSRPQSIRMGVKELQEDTFTAHLREECGETNEILGADAVLGPKGTAIPTSNSYSSPTSVVETPTGSWQSSLSPFAGYTMNGGPVSPRPVQHSELAPEQVLGGFASLGAMPLPTGGKSKASKKHRDPVVQQGFKANQGRPSHADAHAYDSSFSGRNIGPSGWSHMKASKFDAIKVLDIMSIDEMSRHVVDLGHPEDWEGFVLRQMDEDDPALCGELAASRKVPPISWMAARSTQRKRKWISAPASASEDSTAMRTVVVSDRAAATTSAGTSSSSHATGSGAAASSGGAAASSSGRASSDSKPPAAFSGLAAFNLRFLRDAVCDQDFLLAPPSQLREVYDRPEYMPTTADLLLASAMRRKKPRAGSFGRADVAHPRRNPSERRAGEGVPLRRTRSRPAIKLHGPRDEALVESLARFGMVSDPFLARGAGTRSDGASTPLEVPPDGGPAAGLRSLPISPKTMVEAPASGPASAAVETAPTASQVGSGSPRSSKFLSMPTLGGLAEGSKSPLKALSPRLLSNLTPPADKEPNATAGSANAPPAVPPPVKHSNSWEEAKPEEQKERVAREKRAYTTASSNPTLVRDRSLPPAAGGAASGPSSKRDNAKGLGGWLKKKVSGIGGPGSSSSSKGSGHDASSGSTGLYTAGFPSSTSLTSPPRCAVELEEARSGFSLLHRTDGPMGHQWDPKSPYGRRGSASDDNIVALVGSQAIAHAPSSKQKATSRLMERTSGLGKSLVSRRSREGLRPRGLAIPSSSCGSSTTSDSCSTTMTPSSPRYTSPLRGNVQSPEGMSEAVGRPQPLEQQQSTIPFGAAAAGLAASNETGTTSPTSPLSTTTATAEEAVPLELMGLNEVPPGAMSLLIALPIGSGSKAQRLLRVAYIPFGSQHGPAPSAPPSLPTAPSGLGLDVAPPAPPPSGTSHSSHSSSAWYQRPFHPSHAKSTTPSTSEHPSSPQHLLFGAGPARRLSAWSTGPAGFGSASGTSPQHLARLMNRRASVVEAFRVTASILDVPEWFKARDPTRAAERERERFGSETTERAGSVGLASPSTLR